MIPNRLFRAMGFNYTCEVKLIPNPWLDHGGCVALLMALEVISVVLLSLMMDGATLLSV